MLRPRYESFKDPNFHRALAKLSSFPFKAPKTAYNVLRIVRKLENETKLAQELFIKLVKQYAKLDDKGEIKPADGKPGSFEIRDEVVEEWKVKLDEYHNLTAEIPSYRITLDDIADVKLTANEIGAIEELMELGD